MHTTSRWLGFGMLCALAGCSSDPVAPGASPGTLPPGFATTSIEVRVDLLKNTVTLVPPAAPSGQRTGLSYALVGANEVTATTSNLARSAPGAFFPNKVRVTFDVALTNRLTSSTLVPPTWPNGAAGTSGLLLFPFRIIKVVGAAATQVLASTDWNGDGSAGSGAPRNFFNDNGCPGSGITSDCLRWELFPAPLGPGETSTTQSVGFDVPKALTSFTVYLAVAADIMSDLPAVAGVAVTPPSYVMADGLT
ncbi:MAG: hypothetical protein ABI742_10005, partial [Gemmatimonadota bacterium]